MKTLQIFLFVMTTVLATYSQDWQWQNPQPQGNSLQGVKFANENTGYAVGDLGTILKTTDEGQTWDLLITGTAIDLNALFFLNCDTGFAVGGYYFGNVILKTEDGGASWTSLSIAGEVFLNSVFFVNDSVGFIAGRNEFSAQAPYLILKTTDGGHNWSGNAYGSGYDMTGLKSIFFADENVGYAIGSAFLKTTDGGATWTAHNNVSGYSVFFTDENTGYIAGGYGQIRKTTDGGMNWSLIHTDSSCVLKSVWFTSTSTGYAVGGGWSFGTILQTDDAGATWTSLVIPGSGLASVHFPASDKGFTVGMNGQMLKTHDGGTSWNFLSSHITSSNLNSIHFPGVEIGFAAGDSGTILKTSNGGSVWEALNSGVNKSLRSVFFTSLSTGYAVGDSGTILKTIDGGSVWSPQYSGATFNYNSVHFPSADTGYIAGSGTLPGTLDFCAVIFKTVNGGLNWSVVFSDTNHIFAMNTIFFTDVNTGFVGGGYWMGGFILRTTDGGTTWTQTGTGQCRSICFPDHDTGFAVVNDTEPGNSNSLLKTTDGGITWTGYNFFAFVANTVCFVNEDTGYVAGWEGEAGKGAVLRTTDGGSTWSTPLIIISQVLNSLHFTDGQTGYVIGEAGAILKTNTGGGPPVHVAYEQSVNESLKIYPNPASDKITVETPGISKNGHLSILNLSGRELLKQRFLESKSTIDVSRLCTGMYIIKVTDDQGVQVGKIIKN